MKEKRTRSRRLGHTRAPNPLPLHRSSAHSALCHTCSALARTARVVLIQLHAQVCACMISSARASDGQLGGTDSWEELCM